MSNKKKWTLASLIIIVLAVIAGIGYGVGHKDTANTLQSHEWALTNNGQTQTAKFDKSRQFVILELTFMNGGFLMIDILTLNR